MLSLIIFLLAFAISAWFTFLLSRPSSKLRILDHPTERSLHTYPTPRTGGIAEPETDGREGL